MTEHIRRSRTHNPTITPTPISQLHEAANNPRKINTKAVDVVAASIKRFGWKQPIVATRDGEILAGHTRYRAAKQLNHSTVPVIVASDLSPEEARAYRIADNRSSDFSTWDIPLLVDELEDLAGLYDDELALEDWEHIMAEFDRAQEALASLPTTELPLEQSQPEETGSGEGSSASSVGGAPSREDDLMEVPNGETWERYNGEHHLITVVCDSEDGVTNVVAMLRENPHVVDVRKKRA